MNKIKTNLQVPNKLVTNKEGNKATVEVYPFETGYAITLAHPIRRVLLASSVGYAPVALKIEGAAHEFDSIKGVLEDMATIIINLKNARFKVAEEALDTPIEYSFTGPKELYAKDLSNDKIEVVTEDAYIATLNEDVNFNFSIIFRKGMGFVSSENIRDSITQDGFIVLDAFFSPIKKAIYNIENVLVEDDPNFEKIVFQVETDGQIDPVDAFKDSINILFNQFAIFTDKFDIQTVTETQEELEEEYQKLKDPIETLNLRGRSFNCLDKTNIKYVGELVLMGVDEITKIKNLGKKSLDEITEKLAEIGFPVEENLPADVKKILEKEIENLKEAQ